MSKFASHLSAGHRQVWKPLEAIVRRGHHPSQVFRDWIALMTAAFSSDEAEYAATMARYLRGPGSDAAAGERNADFFAHALGALQIAMANEALDYLGDLYMEYVSYGHNGQFFTPLEISRFMAQLTVDETEAAVTICDPACGSGRMLVAALERAPNAVLAGVDIDRCCAQMAALNLLFRNAEGWIAHGDALALRVSTAWQMRRTALGGALRRLPADANPMLVERLREGLAGRAGAGRPGETPRARAAADLNPTGALPAGALPADGHPADGEPADGLLGDENDDLDTRPPGLAAE